MDNGHIKLHRKMQDSEIWTLPPAYRLVWIEILMSVDYKTGSRLFNYEALAERCGISYSYCARILKWLDSRGQIARQKTPRFVLITVNNWNSYQGSSGGVSRGHSRGQSRGLCIKNNKEDNNINIINTTNVVSKQSFGREDINNILKTLKGKVGIDMFVDSSRERFMARHCLTLIEKIGADEFYRRLDVLMEDKFHAKNCNKIRYIYNNVKGFIEPKTEYAII